MWGCAAGCGWWAGKAAGGVAWPEVTQADENEASVPLVIDVGLGGGMRVVGWLGRRRRGVAGGHASRRERSQRATRARRYARVTLPALMQEVHTLRRLGVLPMSACTVWMLGFQRRRVRRWEWETDMPKPGPLPQTSHTEDTRTLRRKIVMIIPRAR